MTCTRYGLFIISKYINMHNDYFIIIIIINYKYYGVISKFHSRKEVIKC